MIPVAFISDALCVCLSVCLLLLNASKITEHRGFVSKLTLSGPILSQVNDKEQTSAQENWICREDLRRVCILSFQPLTEPELAFS